jgi:hypothetical protein
MAKRAEKQERLVDQGSGGKVRLEPRTIYRPIEQKKSATLKIGDRRLVRFHERYRPCRIDPTLSMAKLLEAAGAAAEGLRSMLAAVWRALRLLTPAL